MLGHWCSLLEHEISKLREENRRLEVWKEGSERASGNKLLTPAQAAELLGMSVKTLRRREQAGLIRRCSSDLGVVRYPARDVLRLASAKRKEA